FDWLLAWTAFSCFLAAGAYLRNEPDVFGKTAGRVEPLVGLATLPYRLALRLACELMRWRRRFPPLSHLGEEIWVGGRCTDRDLPPRAEWIVDLTAEFSAPLRLRTHP